MEPKKSRNLQKFIRTLAKVLKFGAQSKTKKLKFHESVKNEENLGSGVERNQLVEEEIQRKKVMEAVTSKIFASISTIKASYAQLQIAQSPYNPDEIQVSDEMVVNELRLLSELKQGYLKKELNECPQVMVLMAEIKEQKSVLKSYEIMGKKIESQLKLKDSEILFLKEKLEENRVSVEVLEKEVDPFGDKVLECVEFSELNSQHFVVFFRRCVESIRGFVKLLICNMSSNQWDLDAAAKTIEPGIVYGNENARYLAFESFVCRVMFEGFQYPKFENANEQIYENNQQYRIRQCRRFFDKFMELKSRNALEILKLKPGSSFGKFCRVKYLGLVHPKMEVSFFGDLNQRNVVNSGGYPEPETAFFTAFSEMAKHVWLLHCLAYSFDPKASIFQVKKGCRFSEVFMENAAEDVMDDRAIIDPRVGLTVLPGFKIGKTVLQCQVYVSNFIES
ncbi:hypothetical protein ACHQM5_004829 [Ranunculus cassubicifolius]